MRQLTYAQALKQIEERDALLKNKTQRIRRLEVQLKNAMKETKQVTPEEATKAAIQAATQEEVIEEELEDDYDEFAFENINPSTRIPKKKAEAIQEAYEEKGLPAGLRYAIPTYATLELELQARLDFSAKAIKTMLEEKTASDRTIKSLSNKLAKQEKLELERVQEEKEEKKMLLSLG